MQTTHTPAAGQQARLNELITVTEQLSDVLEEEIELLEDKPKDLSDQIAQIQKRKTGLSRIYEGHVHFLRQHPNYFDTLEDTAKKELKTVSAEFAELVKENARLLDITRKTSERVANTIIAAIRRETSKNSTYSSTQNQAPSASSVQGYSLNTEI